MSLEDTVFVLVGVDCRKVRVVLANCNSVKEHKDEMNMVQKAHWYLTLVHKSPDQGSPLPHCSNQVGPQSK